MSQAEYTQSQILSQLDTCAADYTFPMLDNGYVYLVDVRLSAYRTERYWALIIEHIGADYRAGGVFNTPYCFGNCFVQTPGPSDTNSIAILSESFYNAPAEDEDFWDIRSETGEIEVRGNPVSYDVSPEALQQHGIGEDQRDGAEVTIVELMRTLVPQHHALWLATEAELNQVVEADVPLILRLDEWHHPDLAEGEMPSTNEAFQMIADVLVSGNVDRYKPSLPPNTHWSNWLESGTL